jgi:Flp pilus assembly CpaF family ATPase
VSEPLDYRLVQRLQATVADVVNCEAHRREATGEPELDRADEQQLALSLIAAAVSEQLQRQMLAGDEIPDRDYDARLSSAVFAAMYGAGELQELLDDSRLENIDINGCDEVWLTYAGLPQPVRHRPLAASDADLIEIVRAQAAHAGINPRPWTPATPELDLRLMDGSRLSAVMSASERPSVSIRRNRFPQMFLDDVPEAAWHARTQHDSPPTTLLELGTVDKQLAEFLRAAVLARMNLMVCGATNAGKTTLLRALINVIPPSERLITIEKALELGLRRHPELHPNVVEWELVLPDAEGRGGIGMDALVRRSLRQNPSRVLVGEVLGDEIVTLLNAMSQGNDGSLSTIHARSSVGALDRIATYAAEAEHLDFPVTHALIAGAIDYIVFIAQSPQLDGRRVVAEVREITGFDGERVTTSLVFAPSGAGCAERAEVSLVEERRARLEAVGYRDLAWFGSEF